MKQKKEPSEEWRLEGQEEQWGISIGPLFSYHFVVTQPLRQHRWQKKTKIIIFQTNPKLRTLMSPPLSSLLSSCSMFIHIASTYTKRSYYFHLALTIFSVSSTLSYVLCAAAAALLPPTIIADEFFLSPTRTTASIKEFKNDNRRHCLLHTVAAPNGSKREREREACYKIRNS